MSEPIKVIGGHMARCTQIGGSLTTSRMAAPAPTNVPIMVMAKKAGPSAVSNLVRLSWQLLQLGESLIGPRNIWPLPQFGQRVKKAAFQFGWLLVVIR